MTHKHFFPRASACLAMLALNGPMACKTGHDDSAADGASIEDEGAAPADAGSREGEDGATAVQDGEPEDSSVTDGGNANAPALDAAAADGPKPTGGAQWRTFSPRDVDESLLASSGLIELTARGQIGLVLSGDYEGFTSLWAVYFDGEDWGEATLLEDLKGNVLAMSSAISAAGDLLVAWVQEDERRGQHLYTRERTTENGRWGGTMEIAPADGMSTLGDLAFFGQPDVAYGADGSRYLAWPGGDLFISKMPAGADSWQAPQHLDPTSGPGPVFVAGEGGDMGVLAQGPCVWVLPNGAEQWLQARCFTPQSLSPRNRKLVITADGRMVLAWLTVAFSNKPASVLVSEATIDSLEWSEPVDLDLDDFGPASDLYLSDLGEQGVALSWLQKSGETHRFYRVESGDGWSEPTRFDDAPAGLEIDVPGANVAEVAGLGLGFVWLEVFQDARQPNVRYTAFDAAAGRFLASELVDDGSDGEQVGTGGDLRAAGADSVALLQGDKVIYRSRTSERGR